MAYTDDGRWIVTAGEDATLKVWDATYHTLIRTIELDDGRATALALSGTRALTGHANGKVVLVGSGARRRRSPRSSATRPASGRSSSPATRTGSPPRATTGRWRLWDAQQPSAPLHVFDGHENAVQALAYAPRAMLLASGSADKTVRLWDLQTLSLQAQLPGPSRFRHRGRLLAQRRMLAGGALDGRIRVWSALSSRRLRSLAGHKGRVADIAFAPDGQMLASAGEDGTVRLWDLRRGRTLACADRAHGRSNGGCICAGRRSTWHRPARTASVRLWAMPLAQLAKD